MTKIFLVSFDLQRDEISTCCFDSCQSISIGAIEVELYEGLPPLLFVPCSRSDCPYLENQVEDPAFEQDGSTFHLRKLIPLATQISIHASSDIAGEGNSPASPGLINAIKSLVDK